MSDKRYNIRELAIRVLLAQQQSGRPLDQVLGEHLSRIALADPRDRQLLQALVHGVLRWRGLIDELVASYSRHPLAGMKPLTLTALRVGIFQLIFLDRIPASAAIDETVKALRAARQPKWITGFVNALLRKVAAERAEIKLGDESATHPLWLRQRWQARFGEQLTNELCRINNRQSPLVLRVNPGRSTAARLLAGLKQAGIEVEPGKFSPAALLLPSFHGRIEELPGYHEGWFAVQDEAAQLVSLLLAGGPPGPYLDACAGLGGKTAHLAELLPVGAKLTALEPQAARFARLKENLARLGAEAEIIQQSLQEYAAGFRQDNFKGILVDAPCSGLGVIRRHPDIRWNRSEADLAGYRQKQLELLQVAAKLLAPGGALVYAVCSREPEENEQVIELLLAKEPELALEDLRPWLPAAAQGLAAAGFFSTLPTDGLDGFFAARLRRTK